MKLMARRLSCAVCTCCVLAVGPFADAGFSQGGAPALDDPDSLIRPALLTPRMSAALRMTGDRLVQPGKERLILTGTLSRPQTGQTMNVRLLREFPRKLRLETDEAGKRTITLFDKDKKLMKTGTASNRLDEDLVESLVFDSVESFFRCRMEGMPIRLLGTRFLLEGDDSADAGRKYFDIYQTVAPVKIGNKQRTRLKMFCFNSDTLQLERVRYQKGKTDGGTDVEIRFSNWLDIGGLPIPGTIRRLEDGVEALVLDFSSAQFGSKQQDASFVTP